VLSRSQVFGCISMESAAHEQVERWAIYQRSAKHRKTRSRGYAPRRPQFSDPDTPGIGN
jgi:hypothetical protein